VVVPNCHHCSDSNCSSNSGHASSNASSNLRPLGTPKFMRGEVDPSKFKTQICVYYVNGEECPYAPHCAFAHGDDEIRQGEAAPAMVAVNTLPRALLIHQEWCRSVKYVRKTGPDTNGVAAMLQSAPPRPSFLSGASASRTPTSKNFSHCPYPPASLYFASD